jgi:hypothetical protein
MVHSRITTSDDNSSNTTMDRNLDRRLGIVNEDRIHIRIYRESKSDQTSSGCKFFATLRTNIDTNREDSRINYTKTRTTSILVHGMRHKGASGKWMFAHEGNENSSWYNGTLSRTNKRSCASICDSTIPCTRAIPCLSKNSNISSNWVLWDFLDTWACATTMSYHAGLYDYAQYNTLWVICIYNTCYKSM